MERALFMTQMDRILYFAEKSNQDKRAEKIFAWLAEQFRIKQKLDNSQFTYPEIKNGRFDWQKVVKWKQSLPKIKVKSIIRNLIP